MRGSHPAGCSTLNRRLFPRPYLPYVHAAPDITVLRASLLLEPVRKQKAPRRKAGFLAGTPIKSVVVRCLVLARYTCRAPIAVKIPGCAHCTSCSVGVFRTSSL